MVELLTLESMEARREANYRRTPQRRIQTVEQARAFVEDVGFCHFWPIQAVEMPNLFHAIAGRVRDVPNEHDDPDIGKCWGWKDDALDKRWWYYGKLVRKRATMVSLELLPAFYACSENYGDYEHDYLDEYRDGKVSAEAKAVYEALLENGALDTVELRKKAHMANDTAKYRFDKTITDLQAQLKLLPVGIAPVGAWKYAFIYDIVPRYFAGLQERARSISRREAQRMLILRHLRNVVAAPRNDVFRTLDVLGWTPKEFEGVLGRLLEEGAVREQAVDWAKRPILLPAGSEDL